MSWTYQDRTRYEAALKRAMREIAVAQDAANDAGDEFAIEELGPPQLLLARLRDASIKRGAGPAPHRPLKGQTSISA